MRKVENRTVKTRIRVTECDAVYYNPLSSKMELMKVPFTVQRTFKTKEGLLKVVKETLNSDEIAVVDVQNIKKTDAIYEVPFDKFMEVAVFVENVEVKEK